MDISDTYYELFQQAGYVLCVPCESLKKQKHNCFHTKVIEWYVVKWSVTDVFVSRGALGHTPFHILRRVHL